MTALVDRSPTSPVSSAPAQQPVGARSQLSDKQKEAVSTAVAKIIAEDIGALADTYKDKKPITPLEKFKIREISASESSKQAYVIYNETFRACLGGKVVEAGDLEQKTLNRPDIADYIATKFYEHMRESSRFIKLMQAYPYALI